MCNTDRILQELRYIEGEEDVQILYACESGSRAWGFASPDSDFDVRFVYARPLRDYIALDQPRDVIERKISNSVAHLPGEFDAVGWDIGKFLKLLGKSNPSAIEWLGSPIVYSAAQRFYSVRELRERAFDPVSSAWHYYGMLKKHDERYLRAESVPVKKYLYCVRAILAARWCIRKFKPAPIPFGMLKSAMLPAELMPEVDRLVALKAEGTEGTPIGHVETLDAFIRANIESLPDEINQYRHHGGVEADVLNGVYRRMLGF